MLDFNKVTKKFLNIQLTDGSKLFVKMPTKRLYDTLLKLKDSMVTVNADETDVETAGQALDEIYALSAEILSNNIGGKKVTSEYLSDIFDLEDIQIFFTSYLEFVTGKLAADPNGPSLVAQTQTARESGDISAAPLSSGSSTSTQG